MANAFYLLILLASLAVWQSGGDDACDSVECLPSTESVCALDEQTGSVALFADECVLRCTGCRTGTEFKKVNGSLCSAGAEYITVCPDVSLNQDNEETSGEDPGDGIVVVEVGLDPDGSSAYDVPPVPPVLLQPPPPPLLPLPLPLLPVGGALLRRLVMVGQPEPRPPPEGLTLISADVKVDVTINLPPAPRPPPPPQPLGQPHHHQHQHHEPLVSTAALPTTHRASAAVAALVAVVVAALHV